MRVPRCCFGHSSSFGCCSKAVTTVATDCYTVVKTFPLRLLLQTCPKMVAVAAALMVAVFRNLHPCPCEKYRLQGHRNRSSLRRGPCHFPWEQKFRIAATAAVTTTIASSFAASWIAVTEDSSSLGSCSTCQLPSCWSLPCYHPSWSLVKLSWSYWCLAQT